MNNKNIVPTKYHFFALNFTPYKEVENEHNTTSIIKEVMTYLMKEFTAGKGYLIDRHKNRNSDGPREIFMSFSSQMVREKRYRCTLALLRAGKLPMLKPSSSFALIPLDKQEGDIAERTHFYIDYSKSNCILCVEYNNNGPRMSDIEYYLRNVANEKLRLAKKTEVVQIMDTSIEKAINNLENVLNIDIKVQPSNLARLDTDLVGQYFTTFTSFGQKLKPNFMKLEAMFQIQGKTVNSTNSKNKEANGMIMSLLKRFRDKPDNKDCFENFVVKYEDKEGNEEILNLLKGKKEIIKEIDYSIQRKERDWYEIIEKDLDDFMESL